MVRGDCWERLYIYIDPLSIYSTIFIIYNLVTYYTRGHAVGLLKPKLLNLYKINEKFNKNRGLKT